MPLGKTGVQKIETRTDDSTQGFDFDSYIPQGGILVWLIVGLELICFATAVSLFAFYRREHPVEFQNGVNHLNVQIGFMLTSLLLISGSCVAAFVKRFAVDRSFKISYLGLAILFGVGFITLKIFDFQSKIADGLIPGLNGFWDYYWFLTGFHFIHVLIGLIFLIGTFVVASSNKKEDNDFVIHGSAAFWHMCDLIWLLLISVFYFQGANF